MGIEVVEALGEGGGRDAEAGRCVRRQRRGGGSVAQLPLNAVLQLIGQGDLDDRRLDHHLARRRVQLAQSLLNHRIVTRRGVDHDGVVGFIAADLGA